MVLPNTNAATWSAARKIFFRFGFLFFLLFIFFTPNGFFPYVNDLNDIYIQPFHKFIPWVGRNILHLPYEITHFTLGSGDTTYDWLMLLLTVLLSVLGSIIWTLADKGRSNYNTLRLWLIIIVRYYVAFTMITYGAAKIIKVQFPFPSPYGLLEPYGASSPMHLAWTFFGYSTAYNYFTGFGEFICGMLLLFRRTIRIGSILTLIMTINIMMVNYCFDVCVKLVSTILVVMSIYLLLLQRKEHAAFFVFNTAPEPDNMPRPRFRAKWFNTSLAVLKYAVIAFVLFKDFADVIEGANKYGYKAPKPPLYGIYDVQTFVKNGDTLAPLTTDTVRWRKLIVSRAGSSVVKMMNDSLKGYYFKTDTVAKRIVMFPVADSTKKSRLNYSFIAKDKLMLRGRWLNDSVTIVFREYDLNNFLLMNRGFHLINELPFNK